MSEVQKRPLKLILTNANTFPYNLISEYHGLSIINSGAVSLVITLSTGMSFSVPAAGTFEDDFEGFKTINATGSTSFQIGLR